MAQAFVALSAWQVMLAGLLFFGGIYLLFGAATWLLTQHILPALGIGRPLDPRPLAPGQLLSLIHISSSRARACLASSAYSAALESAAIGAASNICINVTVQAIIGASDFRGCPR